MLLLGDESKGNLPALLVKITSNVISFFASVHLTDTLPILLRASRAVCIACIGSGHLSRGARHVVLRARVCEQKAYLYENCPALVRTFRQVSYQDLVGRVGFELQGKGVITIRLDNNFL